MESIKWIFESLKLTLYEWMAVFLPGIAGLECIRLLLLPIHNFLPGSPKSSDQPAIFATNVVAYVVVTYLAGLVFQGLSSILVERPVAYVLKLLAEKAKTPPPPSSKTLALKVARGLLREDLPQPLLISFCLSRVDVKRTPYDRFTALRDMCRALTLVAAIAAVGVLFATESRVPSGYRWPLLIVAALAASGLCERFIRYRPLADDALYGLFLSNEIQPPPKAS